jgi:acetyltransferase
MAPGTGKPGKERAEILADLDRDAHKPLVACWIGGEQSAPGRQTCRENGIPVMDSPHSVAKAMARLADHAEGIQSGSSAPETIPISVKEAVNKLPQGKGSVLTEFESEGWLNECGLPLLNGGLAGSKEEALEISERIGYPVALKAMASDVPHKHKMGLVRLNLRDRDAVVQAFEDLSRTLGAVSADRGADILIEPMAAPGVDLLIGAHADPTFGPVVVFGWGGIHTEIFDEVSLRLAPISREETEAMLQEVRGFPALAENELGGRIDLSRIGDALVRVSQVAAAGADRIESIDINPIRLGSTNGDCVVLDATVVLRESV